MLADKPLILALANPEPEILPEAVRAARPDAIVATGRSDYPNQVNNVLCFPFIFRGALDAGATTINEAMKIAAVEAIAALARVEASEVVAAAYGGAAPVFGPEYIIPKPFDPRLILHIAPAVARAAMASGVARRPIDRFRRLPPPAGTLRLPFGQADDARCSRRRRRRPSASSMARARTSACCAACRACWTKASAHPILLGRRRVIADMVRQMGLRMDLEETVRVIDPTADDAVFEPLLADYQRMAGRRGMPPEAAARALLSPRGSVAAAMLVHAGIADAAICGGTGDWWQHVKHVLPIIPRRPGVARAYALTGMILPAGVLFICDTHMVVDPTAEQITEMTLLAAETVADFGLTPKVALLSHSNFGASDSDSARKMRRALALIRKRAPDLEVDGEMHADAALSEVIRNRTVPDSRLTGTANLLVMPSIDAANIASTLLKTAADALAGRPDDAGHVQAGSRAGASGDRARHREPECAGGVAGAESASLGRCRARPGGIRLTGDAVVDPWMCRAGGLHGRAARFRACARGRDQGVPCLDRGIWRVGPGCDAAAHRPRAGGTERPGHVRPAALAAVARIAVRRGAGTPNRGAPTAAIGRHVRGRGLAGSRPAARCGCRSGARRPSPADAGRAS